MNALLKRREELIKAKQEIERKLKLATKIKFNDENKKTLSTINEEFAEIPDNSLVLDMKWDNKVGRLAVLKPDTLHMKSLVSSDNTSSILVLPERADKDTELVLKNGGIGLCYKDKDKNYIFYSNEWHQITDNHKLIGLNGNLILFNGIEKKIKVLTWPGKELLHEIDDIEKIFESTERYESTSHDILVLKYDGSLTYCNLRTFDETVYLPQSSSPKSSFNPKNIIYYNHDKDATLFLVLYEQVTGKLRVLVSGAAQEGSTEATSIPIPKDNLLLKVINPFIIYQDSKQTVHILSLFTLAEETKFDLDHKILSLCMLNEKNFIFILVNGDFIHFNL